MTHASLDFRISRDRLTIERRETYLSNMRAARRFVRDLSRGAKG